MEDPLEKSLTFLQEAVAYFLGELLLEEFKIECLRNFYKNLEGQFLQKSVEKSLLEFAECNSARYGKKNPPERRFLIIFGGIP